MEDTETNLPDLPGVDPDDHIRNLFPKGLSANKSGDVKFGGNVSGVDYESRVNPLTKEFGLKGKTDVGPAKVSGEVQRIGKGTNYSGRVDMGPVNFRGSQSPEGRGIGAGYSKDVGGGRLTADYNKFLPSVGSPGWNANVNYKFDIPVKGWFADGGSVNAQGIASLGRGPDSMLVHMSPREVGGLQQLAMAHGGSLTINPQTGLPEAGFLSNILPIAATVVGSMYGMPWLGAAVSGGMNYMQTGNLGQSIAKGALSYGLGQIGGNMMDAGATELAMKPEFPNVGNFDLWPQDAPPIVEAPAFSDARLASHANIYGADSGDLQRLEYSAPSLDDARLASHANIYGQDNELAGSASGVPTASVAAPVAPAAPGPWEQAAIQENAANQNPATANYKSVAQIKSESPWEAFKAGASKTYDKGLGAFLTDNKTPLMVAGAGLLGSSMFATPKGVNAPSVNKGNIRPYKIGEQTRNPRFGMPGEPYFLGGGYEAQPIYGAAAGGLMGFAGGGDMTSGAMTGSASRDAEGIMSERPFQSMNLVSLYTLARGNSGTKNVAIQELRARQAEGQDINPEADPFQKMASGGIADLGDYAAGGTLLQGPGDGMSDSIPAVIKGPKPQRAALAQGEFVIPADVVSHLGNGSTDAGAKRLYSMMDKIRHARTGNKKQGRQINPDKFMPA